MAIDEKVAAVHEKVDALSETMPTMIRETMLETLQSLGLGLATVAGDLRRTAAPAAAPAPAMQQRTRPAAANPPLVLPDPIRFFMFESQHNNLKGLWDEWYGLGVYENTPIAGGVAELEDSHGAKWRDKGKQQRVSRQGRICLAIKKKSEFERKSIDMVCNEWNYEYLKGNRNLATFVKYLQQPLGQPPWNWIEVRAPRGRRSDT